MSTENPSNVAPQSRLSASEAAQLASGLAELAKAGLPLPGGLRALADEWPSRRLRPALLDLANRLEQGVSLEDAINTVGSRLPAHLRGLIIAGIRSNRLPEALEQYVELERTQHDLGRQVRLSLAYPTLYMVAITIIAFLVNIFIVHQMARILKDFGTSLPGITILIINFSGPFAFFLFILTILLLAIPLLSLEWPGSRWVSPLLNFLPVVGPLLKCSEMARFSRMMSMCLQQKVPLTDSLRLTANGLRDAYLGRACRQAAIEIERGRSFSDCIAARRFSAELLPLIVVGEQASSLGDTMQAAAEMFEGRAYSQGRNLETVLLPVALFVTGSLCGIVIIGIFMPLISLITRLTGGK
jgi:type II secretory pathway component PulF